PTPTLFPYTTLFRSPVAGQGAELLFALGLIGASALAGAVVPLSSAYAISEAVGVERSVSRRFTEARLFLGLFTVQVIIGAALSLDRKSTRLNSSHLV